MFNVAAAVCYGSTDDVAKPVPDCRGAFEHARLVLRVSSTGKRLSRVDVIVSSRRIPYKLYIIASMRTITEGARIS